MDPIKQRIAIAEACGTRETYAIGSHVALVSETLPDYLNDLNAIRDAWHSLRWDEQCAYSWRLYEVCCSNNLNHVVNATAAQRAEAFLKTIGKWEE